MLQTCEKIKPDSHDEEIDPSGSFGDIKNQLLLLPQEMQSLASEIDCQMKEMMELDDELRKIELTNTSSKVDAIKFILHQLLHHFF